MPLCRSKVEQVKTEDLVELAEIEKQNLGQVNIHPFSPTHTHKYSFYLDGLIQTYT